MEFTHLNTRMWDSLCEDFRNGVIKLSGEKFRLVNLAGLEVLVKDKGLQVQELYLMNNRLTSLIDVSQLNPKVINASNNRIEYLCAREQQGALNAWPAKMAALCVLDLSLNRMTQIPDLSNMPNLRELYLQQNSIGSSSFAKLENGRNLEKLDLSNNDLRWGNEESFASACSFFRNLQSLEQIKLTGNSVVDTVPDYAFIIVGTIRSKKAGVIGSRKISSVDNFSVNREMKDRSDVKRKKMASLQASSAYTQGEVPQEVPQDKAEGEAGEIPEKDLYNEEQSDAFQMGETDFVNVAKPKGKARALLGFVSGGNLDLTGSRQVISGIVPSMIQLNASLEECFAHPSMSSEIVSEIVRDVQVVVDSAKDEKYLFQDMNNEDEIKMAIDEFLQNIVLLSERQPQALKQLVQVLAFLSMVRENELGVRCVHHIKDMIGGGDSNVNMINEVLSNTMVPMLQNTRTATSSRVISNLIEISNSPNMSEFVEHPPLENALSFIVQEMSRSRGVAPSDGIVNLCAAASRFRALAIRLGSEKVHLAIHKEITECLPTSTRYSALLTAVRNMCEQDFGVAASSKQASAEEQEDGEEEGEDGVRGSGREDEEQEEDVPDRINADLFDLHPYSKQDYDDDDDDGSTNVNSQTDAPLVFWSAQNFAKLNVHRELMKNLRSLIELKSRGTGGDTCDQLIKESIMCLASMCRSEIAFVSLMDSKLGLFSLLFDLYTSPSCGPSVMAAVLHWLARILTVPESWYPLRYDDAVFEKAVVYAEVTRRLQRVVPLLQYLGERGTKFAAMCNLVPVVEKQMFFRGERKTLATLTSPTMHDLLVSVIKILTIYCREAEQGNLLASRVSEELNANKREAFLFGCLSCPSDSVRLAVVECLKEVQLKEFDTQEINYLVDLLASTVNISSGKNEEVLAGSFVLLSKLCNSEHSSGASFRSLFAERTANVALKVLEQNERRDVRGRMEEAVQKRTLTNACVQFLQTCSAHRSMHVFLRNNENLEKLISVLIVEDLNSRHVKLFPKPATSDIPRSLYWPSHVERTYGGRQVEYLLRVLIGSQAIVPAGVVASRVLRRMADVLMGVPDLSIDQMRVKLGQAAEMAGSGSGQTGEGTLSSPLSAEQSQNLLLPRPGWMADMVRDSLNSRLSSRSLANRLARRENRMPSLWNTCLGYTAGCSDALGSQDEKYLTPEELADKQSQHGTLMRFSGMERVLLFLVSSMESGMNKADTQGNSTVVSATSVAQLLASFRVDDVLAALDRTLRTKFVDFSQSRSQLSGPEMLLRNMMSETSLDSSSDVNNTEYPEADSAMLVRNADLQLRRPQETTEVIIAGLRVIFALLRFGDSESTEAARKVLQNPSKLRVLACICSGDPSNPMWQVSLIGAKFMAICYELCVMPGLRREESVDMLPIYAVVCHVAKRIISTLAYLADSRSLSEADLVIAMHTTRTLALISSQLLLLRIPNMKKQMHSQRLSDIWEILLPFDITINGCISLITAANASTGRGFVIFGQPNEDGDNREQLLVNISEHVTQILVATFSVSGKCYEILEKLSRTQILEPRSIKNAFISDLLARVAFSNFSDHLLKFLLQTTTFSVSQGLPDSGGGGEEEVEKTPSTSGVDGPKSRLSTIPRKQDKVISSGFFAFCTGPRVTSLKPLVAEEESQGFFNTKIVEKQSQRTWFPEIPPPLPYSAVAATNDDDDDKNNTDNEEPASPSRTGYARWELDRIGNERILFASFADVYSQGTAPNRLLLVLSSEAYYMFAEPSRGGGWGVASPADELYSNPLVFVSPELFKENPPRLLWRRPYRAVERLCKGSFGERIHILHRSSDFTSTPGTRPAATTLTICFYVTGLAARCHAWFLQMSREWAVVERQLGVEPAYVQPPNDEPDVPSQEAVKSVLAKIDGSSSETGANRTDFNHEVDEMENDHENDQRKWSGEQIGLYCDLPGVFQVDGPLMTQVLLLHHWEFWSFPIDVSTERLDGMRKIEELVTNPSLGDDFRAQQIGVLNARLSISQQQQLQQQQKILKIDPRNRNTHMLYDLNELILDRGKNAVLTLGFGKRATQRSSLLRGSSDAQRGVLSTFYYDIQFYDSTARDMWTSRLLPLLKSAK